jgi:AhpD family alkylhydroperoxidase
LIKIKLVQTIRRTTRACGRTTASAIRSRNVRPGLDARAKELIAWAISVAIRCDDCIAFHAKSAVENGASREEALETLGVVYVGAGPSAMYASHALGTFGQFQAARPAAA